MEKLIYDQLWIFFVYSFVGWIIGTILAAYRRKKFVDVGFLYGPYCPSYGICGVLFFILLHELHNQWFFMFLGGAIISSFVVCGINSNPLFAYLDTESLNAISTK